ncbi:MAG: deaminase [Stackebrandtia sp.]
MDDAVWLRRAVELSRRCPPSQTAFSVGALIVADGMVVAEGRSREEDPHDHAEEVALRRAGRSVEGAVVYSSLEPCGRRASRPDGCASLIVRAGVARVVFAWREPDTFGVGGGAEVLRAGGVDVDELAALAAAAAAVNAHLTPSGSRLNE